MGMIKIARMLTTLIIGLIAEPAVSLYGSPTVSPVTAAAWAKEPLPPRFPSSINFFALSHAAPPGTAMEPRVPQNLIRTGDAETLGMDGKAPIFPRICDETKCF